MAVSRASKDATLAGMSERLASVPMVVIADYRGTTVKDISAFRSSLKKAGLHYEVVKNTLARRVLKGTPMEGLTKTVSGMSGWVFSNEDAIASAKLLRDIGKTYKTIAIRGGWFDGLVLDETGVAKVAELPSKEELRSQLLATIQEAPTKVVRVIQAPARDLLFLLQNFANKLNA